MKGYGFFCSCIKCAGFLPGRADKQLLPTHCLRLLTSQLMPPQPYDMKKQHQNEQAKRNIRTDVGKRYAGNSEKDAGKNDTVFPFCG